MKRTLAIFALLPGVAPGMAWAHPMHSATDAATHGWAHVALSAILIGLAVTVALMWSERK